MRQTSRGKHEGSWMIGLIVILGSITLLTGIASGQITPSGDAYIDTTKPTTNFGTAVTLGVVSPSQTAFIAFDLSSIPAGYTGSSITKATLKLYVSSVTTAGSLNVDLVNGSWTEATLTANNAPALGSTIAASVPLTKSQVRDYVLIDITQALQSWLNGTPNDGIALVANSPLAAAFESKENIKESHNAELDVVFASSGGAITGVLTGAGSGLTGGGTSGTLNLSLLTSCSSGQTLTWNGSAWGCATVTGTGTVTSVGLSAPTSDFTVSGSPVTSNGTLGLNWAVAPTSANTANAIVKRDSTGSFNANNITASGQVLVNNGSLLNPILSQASAANAAAIVGTATGTGVTNGVRGTSSSSGAGSAGVTGIDGNTTSGTYTAGLSGYTVNPTGVGVLGTGKTLSKVGQSRLGTAAAGVWADNPNFGLVATSDLNAIVAYNNSTGGATIYGENDTTSGTGFLLYMTAPNTGGNFCAINTTGTLQCSGNLEANDSIVSNHDLDVGGNVGIGTPGAPQASLQIDKGGTENQDTLLLGNSSKGLLLRDTGTDVDIESQNARLFINGTTTKPVIINGPVSIATDAIAGILTVTNTPLPSAKAAYLQGDVSINGDLDVTGTVSKGGGSFKIDHPLDPANKYLYHSFVESPDMMDIYNGIVVLNKKGQAVVTLPEWFEALNRDFRYQLTAIGAPEPNLYIAREISSLCFKIAGGRPGGKVSWQVTGIRHDAWAEAHRVPVEEPKPAAEMGRYLHPELFGASEELRVRPSNRNNEPGARSKTEAPLHP